MAGKPASEDPEDLFIFHHMRDYYSFDGIAYLGCLIDCGESGRAVRLLVNLEAARQPFAHTHGVRLFWADPMLKVTEKDLQRADPFPFCQRRTHHQHGLKAALAHLREIAQAPICQDLHNGPLDAAKGALSIVTLETFFLTEAQRPAVRSAMDNVKVSFSKPIAGYGDGQS